jgi:hypothetical protein
METKKGLAYMLVGIGLGAGAMATYHHYLNGNLQNTYERVMNKAQNKLEDMM